MKAMDYEYQLQVVEDGNVTFSRMYANAIDAVNSYNRFVDHGTCRMSREIILIEPTGQSHSKTFEYPFAKKLQIN